MLDTMDIRQELAKGFVKFTYQKVDGTTRVAVGTRNKDLLERLVPTNEPVESLNTKTTTICPYYDLMLGEWRSFRDMSIMSIEQTNMPILNAVVEAMVMAISKKVINDKLMSNVLNLVGMETETKLMDFFINNHIGNESAINQNELADIVEECLRQIAPPKANEGKHTKESIFAELVEVRRKEEELILELINFNS